MALCHRIFIAIAAVTLFALPYLRRTVVGTSCNAHASAVVANAAANSQCAAAVHLLDLDKLLSCSEVRKALATCDCGPEKRARKYRYLSHFARACTYCEAGTAMWLQNLARQFEGLELEL